VSTSNDSQFYDGGAVSRAHVPTLAPAVMNLVWRTACVAAAMVVIAACSDASPASHDGTKVSGTIVTTSTSPDIYDVTHPPAEGEFVGALLDVSAHTCEQTPAGWRVTGTATNPTADEVDYRVYISLLNSSLITRALVEAEVVSVASGEAGTFDTLIALGDGDLRCVLRVERRPS